MGNADLALTLLLTALNHVAEIGNLISNARAQGRDITDAELEGLRKAYDTARAELMQNIAKS